jgi:hypothetical protein
VLLFGSGVAFGDGMGWDVELHHGVFVCCCFN